MHHAKKAHRLFFLSMAEAHKRVSCQIAEARVTGLTDAQTNHHHSQRPPSFKCQLISLSSPRRRIRFFSAKINIDRNSFPEKFFHPRQNSINQNIVIVVTKRNMSGRGGSSPGSGSKAQVSKTSTLSSLAFVKGKSWASLFRLSLRKRFQGHKQSSQQA